MKRSLFILVLLLIIWVPKGYSWGAKGHRITGKIAENHLSKKSRKAIDQILGGYTLAEVSTFMDDIKSDNKFRHMNPWHYCTIPDDMTYEEAGVPEEGDAIQTIQRLIMELKSKEFTDVDEAFALKCLVHLIGDIHQPLHVGNGDDRGGNDVDVEYFWERSNLHRVWDSGIIEKQGYSYTEYVSWISHYSAEELDKWQNDGLMDWIMESKSLRSQVYDLPENKKIGYQYNYKNIDIVNERLVQAGIRLAAVLNEIYN